MKNTWKWIIGVAVILAVFLAVPTFLWGFFGHAGMMGGGYGTWSHPMMGAYNYSPFSGLFMGFGMLLVWVLPVAILGLVIYGAVRLANNSGSSAHMQACSNCGKPVLSAWNNCPHCGTDL